MKRICIGTESLEEMYLSNYVCVSKFTRSKYGHLFKVSVKLLISGRFRFYHSKFLHCSVNSVKSLYTTFLYMAKNGETTRRQDLSLIWWFRIISFSFFYQHINTLKWELREEVHLQPSSTLEKFKVHLKNWSLLAIRFSFLFNADINESMDQIAHQIKWG